MPSLLKGYQFKLQIGGVNGGVFLQGTKFPGRRTNDITLDIGGTSVKYPGIPVNDTNWSLKCFDDLDMSNRRVFERIMGDTPFFMDKPVFQRKQDLTMFFGNTFDRKLVLYNAYIQNLGDATMDMSNTSPVEYEVTFNFQYWKFVD